MYKLKVNTYKNFPSEGIVFIDLTPSLFDKELFNEIVERICKTIPDDIDYIISPESRGFIYGGPTATKKGIGFIPVRKLGKYPESLITKAEYNTEYSTDILSILSEDLKGKRVWFVDDIFATGGTLNSSKQIVSKLGGEVIGATCIYDIGIVETNENIYFLFNKDELEILRAIEL